jgi:serine/threonine-protein kinase RsbW
VPKVTKHIKIASEKESLRKLRAFLIGYLNQYPISDIDLNLLIVAVDEICANIIVHANKNNETPYIEIELRLDEIGIEVEILDRGRKFSLLAQQDPSLGTLIEKRRKGGVGIMLVKRIMDRIEYIRENNYNIHRLYKRLSVPTRLYN